MAGFLGCLSSLSTTQSGSYCIPESGRTISYTYRPTRTLYTQAAYTTPAIVLYNDSVVPIGVQMESRRSRNAKIAIAVVVPVVFLVLVIALVVFCLKRRRRKRANIAEASTGARENTNASLDRKYEKAAHHDVAEKPVSGALHSNGPAELGDSGQTDHHELHGDQPSYLAKQPAPTDSSRSELEDSSRAEIGYSTRAPAEVPVVLQPGAGQIQK
ncbi:hypothetical protein HII31_01054 [Pseudocercospora fuligena]|uniref:Transmembrane protein n=1 Tax=Pseudocercospora fuligena TaxID=685502 RepID=A0A8H6RSC5_9PEZI|nr:hypothetical protein HII31_01054 [Pseudocercospora fuligena]